MTYPANANAVVLRGFWWDEHTHQAATGTNGQQLTITFTPVPLSGSTAPNLTDLAATGYIKTKARTVTPHPVTGFFAIELIPNDDPDLEPFAGWRVTLQGEQPFTITVTQEAPTVTADQALVDALPGRVPPLLVGDSVQAMWITEAALVTTPPPEPPESYLTADQTYAAITSAVTGVSLADATTGSKGKARLMGGTADAPTVPTTSITGLSTVATTGVYNDLTGKPTIPSTPGAVGAQPVDTDLTAIAALDASTSGAIASDGAGWIKKTYAQFKTALGLSTVATSGAYTDLTGTPTIPAAYTDEQAQDAAASLITTATHSGLTAAYDDTANTLALTVTTGGVPTSRTISTTAPLTGGGDLTANRTLAITTGTAASTVAAGDDNRFGVNFAPSDHGMVAWTFDPIFCDSAAGVQPSSDGHLYWFALKHNKARTVTGVVLTVTTAGVTLTSNRSFVGLYDSSDTLVAVSADQSASWNSTGNKTIPFSASQSLAAGTYYVGIITAGTTRPTFASLRTMAGGPYQTGRGGTALRAGRGGTTNYTALPSTKPSPDVSSTYMWCGLY